MPSTAHGYWKPADLPAGTRLWHYTSAQGLVGMMTNREVWATESTGLNDVSEITEGFAYIRDWLASRAESVAPFLLRLAQAGGEAFTGAQRMFILCASMEGDDAGQWRLYGGPRAGYAVELDSAVPLGVVSRAADPAVRGSLFRRMGQVASVAPWYAVAYASPERDCLLSDLIDWAENENTQYEDLANDPSHDPDELDSCGQDLAEKFVDALATAGALIKSPGFSGEREVRALVSVALRAEHQEFRATTDAVVRYVRLAAGDGQDLVMPERDASGALARTLPIRSITVRRTPYFETTRLTLEDLVSRAGLIPADVDIIHSNVELRW